MALLQWCPWVPLPGVLGGVAGVQGVAVPGWNWCWMCRKHQMNSGYTVGVAGPRGDTLQGEAARADRFSC